VEAQHHAFLTSVLVKSDDKFYAAVALVLDKFPVRNYVRHFLGFRVGLNTISDPIINPTLTVRHAFVSDVSIYIFYC
jgi:hypothetical protein